MPQVNVYTISGEKEEKVNLPKEIFAAKINPALMAQAVRVYLANQRKAHPKVKTRSEVNRTKAKWYRQKGTGKARHGSRAANIFVGGGVVHGPTGLENYKLKMSKKLKRKALFSALTNKFKEKNILIVKGLKTLQPKTKEMAKVLKNLKIFPQKKMSTLLVLPKNLKNVKRAARNIEGLSLSSVGSLNTYKILSKDKIIFPKESLLSLEEIFLKK